MSRRRKFAFDCNAIEEEDEEAEGGRGEEGGGRTKNMENN